MSTTERAKYNDRLVYWTSLTAIAATALMAGVKIYGWHKTQSIVMLASLLDSLIDGLMSIFIFFSVRLSIMSADENHRFGHGKAEAIAAFVQGIILFIAAVFLLWQATTTIAAPREIFEIAIGIYSAAICVVITLALVALQTWTIKKTGSLALRADSLHYRADILLYLLAVATLALTSYTSDTRLDAAFGIIVSGYIGWQAFAILWEAMNQLMDEELPDSVRGKIKERVMRNSGVRGIHDLRTRASGRRKIIQFHIEMDGLITLHRAHEISDRVEGDLMLAFPDADIIIHQDPEGVEKFTPLEKT